MGRRESADLTRLVESVPKSKDRLDEVYLAVATLFERQKPLFSSRERALASDILKHLTKDVEMSIRIALAERLADSSGAPEELVLMLADDRIEVARPLLARSPVLSDEHLLRVIEHGAVDHHIAVAERPAIGETVSAALARTACEAVILTLLKNSSAKISEATFEELAERAREIAGLQKPLVERQDLPLKLASRMYVWVSGGLKTALANRYPHVAQSLGRALDETTTALQNGKAATSPDSAKKLIDKLAAAGQLRSSFLIRVLQQGQMELFELGFAALLQTDVGMLRRALYGSDPRTVALACRAAGIDRSVFMTVYSLSRQNRKVAVALSEDDLGRIQAVFNQIPKIEALSKLKILAA